MSARPRAACRQNGHKDSSPFPFTSGTFPAPLSFKGPGVLPKKNCASWVFRELSRSVNFVGDVPLLIFLEVKELDL